MKIYRILLFACLLPFVAVSCFEDETTLGNGRISEIFIEEGSIDSVYDIYRNEELIITPVLSQSNKDKSLNYRWEIDLEEYSTDSVFRYVGQKLGSFNCRYIVENEDGKTFHPFVLNVNSPYEEGIAVLSSDEEGESMLSFMKKPLQGEENLGFFDYDCFTTNNPDVDFVSNAVDILQCSGQLLLACQGSDAAGDIPTIYYMNEKTLVVENVLTAAEYPDFIPTMLCVPALEASGVTYPILCKNNKIYELSTTEGQVEPSTMWRATYQQKSVVYSGSSSRFDILLWDNELGGLRLYYNGYGPYVCNEDWDAVRKGSNRPDTLNYFKGRNFVTMAYINKTSEQLAIDKPELLVVSANGILNYCNVLYTGFWVTDLSTYESTLLNSETMVGFGQAPFNAGTPCIANHTYRSFFYAVGNKVYRWYYPQQFSTVNLLQKIGSDDAIITAFELSPDHKKTYVAFYEPSKTGKNGSVWVIDTDKGDVLEKYDNVCYKPSKIIYKKR